MKTAIKTKFNLYNIRNSLAFTLAEVLITLGIIGIVAAMTIPTLINNSKKQETVTKLQKIYSTLQQAVKMSEIENGPVSNWDFTLSDNDFLNTYFVPYLAVIKSCIGNQDGCWASDFNARKKKDGSVYQSVLTWSRLVLKDGTFIALTNQVDHAHLYVDIDGLKGKSILGRDVFEFTLTPVAFTDDYHIISNSGLYLYGHGLARSLLLSRCNDPTPTQCSALIQIDGWKISDDYKW